MRILFVSIVEPYGPRAVKGGATTVTRGLIHHWRRAFAEDGAEPEIEIVANHVLPAGQRRARQALSLLTAPLRGRPAKVLYQETGAFRRRIEEALTRLDPDLVIVNGSDLHAMVRKIIGERKVPLWIVVHNVESDLYASQLEALPAVARPLLAPDLARLRREEASAYQDADRLILLCREDSERIEALDPGSEATHEILPVQFDGQPYRERGKRRERKPGEPLRLGMLGDLGWWPNMEGARWFAEDIWPRIEGPAEWHLFGRGSDGFAEEMGENVTGHGMVDDLDSLWGGVDLMVCPVLRGGGVRIKNAEAVWNGVPILTNRLGMRGVEEDGAVPVIIREDAEAWVAALDRLVREPDALKELARERRD